jgi:hypothetical protein
LIDPTTTKEEVEEEAEKRAEEKAKGNPKEEEEKGALKVYRFLLDVPGLHQTGTSYVTDITTQPPDAGILNAPLHTYAAYVFKSIRSMLAKGRLNSPRISPTQTRKEVGASDNYWITKNRPLQVQIMHVLIQKILLRIRFHRTSALIRTGQHNGNQHRQLFFIYLQGYNGKVMWHFILKGTAGK